MKITILETGIAPAGLADTYGTYGQMFETMLAPLLPDTHFEPIAIYAGEALPEPTHSDGFLITGSPAGVYEDHSWIAPLEELTRKAVAAGKPVVGICFGHQLMAQAFGGRVEKSQKGWGVGVHHYSMTDAAKAFLGARPDVRCAVSHQDQVVDIPSGATRLAGSAFCPNGMISYAQGPALSLQMHPEFTHDFAAALLQLRSDAIPSDVATPAQESLQDGSDRGVLAAFIAKFYQKTWS